MTKTARWPPSPQARLGEKQRVEAEGEAWAAQSTNRGSKGYVRSRISPHRPVEPARIPVGKRIGQYTVK